MKIQKLNIISFARFQGLLGAMIGLLAGIIYAFGGLILDTLVTLGWIVSPETAGISHGSLLAFGAIIGMPLIGLMAGLMFGFISAIIYNLFAKWIGSIAVDFE